MNETVFRAPLGVNRSSIAYTPSALPRHLQSWQMPRGAAWAARRGLTREPDAMTERMPRVAVRRRSRLEIAIWVVIGVSMFLVFAVPAIYLLARSAL